MRLLFIRHGDPDYVHDTLTEKGHREAALLAGRMAGVSVKDYYVSPLGRAKDTASYTLKKVGREAKVLDWLEEFKARVDINSSAELVRAYPNMKKGTDGYHARIPWDIVPGYWTEHEEYFSRDGWRHSEVARCSDMEEIYDWAAGELDSLLASYGYVREGAHYRVEKENEDTVVFFCHFGITCVLLSHLWGISPFLLWHEFALAPTSVTELVTEERQQGIACFRATHVGDISHLYAGGEEPSFAARFCEVYGNGEERH